MTYFASQVKPEDMAILADGDKADILTTATKQRDTVIDVSPASLDVRYEVAFQIGQSVPEVQAVFTQLEGRILRVWTVVPERDDTVYRKIYAHERELLETLDGIEFEFNIIPNMGKSPREVFTDPSGVLVFTR